MSIPVFKSYIKRKDMDTVLSCLMTDSIGPGPFLERFQKAAREYFGYEFGFFVRSPIEALGLGLEALGIGRGDRVLISALAPRWYASVLESRGVGLSYADVSQETGNPGPQDFAAAREREGEGVKAVLLAGGGGILPEPGAYEELGLPLLEDATRCLGASRDGKAWSSSATLGLLSLEGGSLLTSGGGALLFAAGRREATVLRNLAEGLLAEARMTDYNASLGLAQLKELERGLEKRRELRTLFLQALAGKKHRPFVQGGEAEPGSWSFPVVMESSIKDAIAYARKKEVETELAFADSCVAAGLVPEGLCPNAKSLSLRTLLFPLHQRIGNAGAQKISRVLATLP